MKKIEVSQVSKIEGLVRKVILIKNNWALLENFDEEQNFITSYDVVKINKTNKDVNTFFLKLEQGSEFFSKSNKWGKEGFTFNKKHTALKYIENIF